MHSVPPTSLLLLLHLHSSSPPPPPTPPPPSLFSSSLPSLTKQFRQARDLLWQWPDTRAFVRILHTCFTPPRPDYKHIHKADTRALDGSCLQDQSSDYEKRIFISHTVFFIQIGNLALLMLSNLKFRYLNQETLRGLVSLQTRNDSNTKRQNVLKG